MEALSISIHQHKSAPTSATPTRDRGNFAIPAGSGNRVDIIELIPVEVSVEKNGHHALTPAVPGIQVFRTSRRAALIALQLHLEWAYIDLSQAPISLMTPADKQLLASLAKHFAVPQNGIAPLNFQDRSAFLELPIDERRTLLDRQARLSPPEEDSSNE